MNLVEKLAAEGAVVSVYDPKAMDKARAEPVGSQIRFAQSALDAAKDAEALIVATEWPEFASVDLAALRATMHTPLVFDGRNLLDPAAMRDFGFQYRGIGRGVAVPRM